MKPQFTSDDSRFLAQDIDRLRAAWSKTDILTKCLKLSCGAVLGASASGDLVAGAAVSALLERTPFSLVRVGDGEGNVLSVLGTSADAELDLKAFNCSFHDQDLQCLSAEDAFRFATAMEGAIRSADIVGIRAFNPWDASGFNSLDLEYAQKCLAKGNFRGAHGLIHATRQIERLLEAGHLSHTVLTQAWVHVSLLSRLSRIIEACESLIVITGRNELRDEFGSRFSSKAPEFICIPLEGTQRQNKGSSRHFPDHYHDVVQKLDRPLSGTLVLVGAGLFGKTYCYAARASGAVALDLGSAFDILSGVRTRPVHDGKFIERMRWLDPA